MVDLGLWGLLALWRHTWVGFLAVYAIQGSSHAWGASGDTLLKDYWLEIWFVVARVPLLSGACAGG